MDAKEIFEKEQALAHYEGEDRIISSAEYLEEQGAIGAEKGFSVHSSFARFDQLIDGFRGGEMITITGPTKQGKTSFAHNLTKQFEDQGITSTWFSYEVGPSQIIEQFSKAKIFYLPRRLKQRSVSWLIDRAIESKLKHPEMGAIFIDTLDEVVSLEKVHNHSIETGVVASEIKALAIDLNIPIFALVHLTKTKYEEIPTEADIRDSSFIAQKSDKVLIVWRERKLDKRTKIHYYTGLTKVIDAADRRKGESMNKSISFHFDLNTKELSEAAQDYNDEVDDITGDNGQFDIPL